MCRYKNIYTFLFFVQYVGICVGIKKYVYINTNMNKYVHTFVSTCFPERFPKREAPKLHKLQKSSNVQRMI